MTNRAEARISLEAIKNNALSVMALLKEGCRMLAVVKADAYGHGAIPVAKALYSIGVRNFAVATANEGAELREGGLEGDILVLGKTPAEEREVLVKYGLCQTCDSVDYAKAIVKDGYPCVHIKIDTGMSRLGFYCHDAADADRCANAVAPLFDIPDIKVKGIFTHFAVADEDSKDCIAFTRKQFDAFKAITDKLMAMGFDIGLRHCCNSAASVRFPEMHLDMVRQGIGLYGLERSVPDFPFVPAMTLCARVAAVGELKAEDTVSYGRTYIADKPMRRAVISLGYADGMPRLLSGRYSISINGKKAPILGRICMDMFMVDATDIVCCEGDTAVIFGKDGEVSEMADIIGTINYELVCGITRRVPRIYE